MYSSLEMTTLVAVSDFTEDLYYKLQSVEADRLVEYCSSTITDSGAAESAKLVSNGVKSLLSKIVADCSSTFTTNNDAESASNCCKNPLMIDLIVKNILRHLPSSDLCISRLVCRLWNTEGVFLLRRQVKKQRITFYPDNQSVEKLQTFTSFVIKDSKSKSYEGPIFSIFSFTSQSPTLFFSPQRRLVMEDFLTHCGQYYVTVLELFLPDESHLPRKDFVAFFILGMPCLRRVHYVNLPRALTQSPLLEEGESLNLPFVTHLRIDRTWEMESCWSVPFLQDLLSLMPNLEDYELWTWNSTTEDDHSEPYIISLSPENVEKVRTLRPGCAGDALCKTIAGLGLSLRCLFLPVLNRGIHAESLEGILHSQRHTLVEAQLNLSTMKDTRLLVFPKMVKLERLHVIVTHPWGNDYTPFLPPIDYDAQLPSLRILEVELAIYNDANLISYFFPCKESKALYHPMEELDLSFTGFRNEKFIPTLAALFPSLKRLQLDGYGCKIYSHIFASMPQLEELELILVYGFNVDDQMVGVGKEECKEMKKTSLGPSSSQEKFLQLRASLSNLTKLHSLTIRQKDYQAKFWPDAQCITNITAYVALAHMKQLRHLMIEKVKFTDECKDYLKRALEDCWLEFT